MTDEELLELYTVGSSTSRTLKHGGHRNYSTGGHRNYSTEDMLSIIKSCIYFDVPVDDTFSAAMLGAMVAKLQELENAIDALRKQVPVDSPKCPEHGRYLHHVAGSQIWSCDQEWEHEGKAERGHSYTTLALYAAGMKVNPYG